MLPNRKLVELAAVLSKLPHNARVPLPVIVCISILPGLKEAERDRPPPVTTNQEATILYRAVIVLRVVLRESGYPRY